MFLEPIIDMVFPNKYSTNFAMQKEAWRSKKMKKKGGSPRAAEQKKNPQELHVSVVARGTSIHK